MSDGKLKFAKKGAAAPAAGEPTLPGKQKDVKKRWMYVGVGVIGLVVISSAMFGEKPPEKNAASKKPEKNAGMVSVNPKDAEKTAFQAQFAQDLEKVKQQQASMQAQLEAKDKKIAELMEAPKAAASAPIQGTPLPPGITPPPQMGGRNDGGLGVIGAPTAAPKPPEPPKPSTAARPPVGVPPSAGAAPELPTTFGGLPPVNDTPLVFDAPSKTSNAGSAEGAAAQTTGTPNAKIRMTKNASAGLLPAGAFAPVSLLNGLDAGTSTVTQSNPMPVLLNVTEQATLPGAAKYRLKNCFVLGTGYGDLSAERVYIRFSRLSCIDKADRLVLSQEVAGYVVDSDGKLGLRGVVTDRQGAKLGKAMLAGFAQGLAGALGQAQSTVTSSSLTGAAVSSISGGNALRASGLQGAQTAASQLADFYLREAQAIFPVITVDAGRTGTIVFTNSIALNWSNGDQQFTQQVTPTNK